MKSRRWGKIASQQKHIKWSIVLFTIVPILMSVFAVLIQPTIARAITAEECNALYPPKTILGAPTAPKRMDFYAKGCNTVCTVTLGGGGISTVESCGTTTPTPTPTPTAPPYDDLQSIICASVIPVGGTVLSNCYNGVKTAYDGCVARADGTTGYVRETMLSTSSLANCIHETYKDVDAATIKSSLDKQATETEDIKKCESGGGTWDASKTPPCTPKKTETPPTTTDKPTCASKMSSVFAWILCPAVEAISRLNDTLFEYIIGSILDYQPITKDDGSLKKVWETFVNYANIGLAIVFIIIIYSTAVGGKK